MALLLVHALAAPALLAGSALRARPVRMGLLPDKCPLLPEPEQTPSSQTVTLALG